MCEMKKKKENLHPQKPFLDRFDILVLVCALGLTSELNYTITHAPNQPLLSCPYQWAVFACCSWLWDVPSCYTGEYCLTSPDVWMEKSHSCTACNSVQGQHLLGWIDLLGEQGSVWRVKREQAMQNDVVPRDSWMFRKHSTWLKKRKK